MWERVPFLFCFVFVGLFFFVFFLLQACALSTLFSICLLSSCMVYIRKLLSSKRFETGTSSTRPRLRRFFLLMRATTTSAALKKREDAEAAAVASAKAAEEKTAEAVALVTRQAEEAKDNATALGKWLVALGLEQEELKGQLAAAQSNR